jgi:hypothetical protein
MTRRRRRGPVQPVQAPSTAPTSSRECSERRSNPAQAAHTQDGGPSEAPTPGSFPEAAPAPPAQVPARDRRLTMSCARCDATFPVPNRAARAPLCSACKRTDERAQKQKVRGDRGNRKRIAQLRRDVS